MNPHQEFQAGVTACLRSWSALRTAVESGWGGGERESQSKADDLRRNILNNLDGSAWPPPKMDATDLADALAIYVEEEFSVTLEDRSEQQVADTIFKMYEGCCKRDPSFARQMVAHAESAVTFNSQFPVQIKKSEHDDDDDDDDMGVASAAGVTTPQTGGVGIPTTSVSPIPENYSDQSVFGKTKKDFVATGPSRQLGESVIETVVEEMDEDGFTPVKKGR